MIEYSPILGGDIKVNVSELEKILHMIDPLISTDTDREYFDYFAKKYLLLPSLRRKERDAYNNLNLAGRIDNKSSVYVEMVKEYNQLRLQRMKLQAELEEVRNNKYSYLL